LGHLLPHSQEAVDLCVKMDGVLQILKHTEDAALVKSCVKCLVACTQKNQQALAAACALPSCESKVFFLLTFTVGYVDRSSLVTQTPGAF
jgi:hypothetical protein